MNVPRMTVRLAWLEEVTICGFWRTRTLWVIHFGLCLSLIQLYQFQYTIFLFILELNTLTMTFVNNHFPFFKMNKEKLKLVLILKSLFPHFAKMFVCFVLVFKYSCDQKGKGIIPVGHTSYIKSVREYASLACSSPHLI